MQHSFHQNLQDFNPRPREEGDASGKLRLKRIVNFNPRPREEGDIFLFFLFSVLLYFNPRPREEGDSYNNGDITCDREFQSTPS